MHPKRKQKAHHANRLAELERQVLELRQKLDDVARRLFLTEAARYQGLTQPFLPPPPIVPWQLDSVSPFWRPTEVSQTVPPFTDQGPSPVIYG